MDDPNVILVEGFVADSAALFDQVRESAAWDERMRARKTASYGVPYNYSGMLYPERPMLPCLDSICDQLELCLGYRPNNCLLNFYADGDSTMGYHFDATDGLVVGTGISIVSLGAERSISFRRISDNDDVRTYALGPGSLLHMDAETQAHWKHAVPRSPGAGARISLTFRLLAWGEI